MLTLASFCVISVLVIGLCEGSTSIVTIGILAQPASDPLKITYYHPSESWSFVAGSYVDWIGSSGAMAVILPYDLPKEKLIALLENIDGVLLPGGGAPLYRNDDTNLPTLYQQGMDTIIRWAKKRNDEGHYFPVFCTCLGFEGLIISETNQTKTLECDFDDEVVVHSVQVTSEFDKSPFWNKVGLSLAKSVFKQNSIYYTHSCGIRSSSFLKNSKLTKDYNLLGTSVSKHGVEFVACIEHKKYPIVANQWHPEKNLYERGPLYEIVDRNHVPVELMQKIASKFVQEIREKGKPKQYSHIPPFVKERFASNNLAETLPLASYERLYTLQRYDYSL